MKILQQLNATLAGNGQQSFSVSGASEFYVQSATADVFVSTENFGEIKISAKMGVRTQGGFSRITVRDSSGSSNNVVLLVGFGDVIDNR